MEMTGTMGDCHPMTSKQTEGSRPHGHVGNSWYQILLVSDTPVSWTGLLDWLSKASMRSSGSRYGRITVRLSVHSALFILVTRSSTGLNNSDRLGTNMLPRFR